MKRVNLAEYHQSYESEKGVIVSIFWYLINVLFFINPLFPTSGIKVALLKFFGASIGQGVVIKPGINIKFPWRLKVGNHVWLGENVWIDNLDEVIIEDHVCVSQGALLLTGNHDYKSQKFDLITGKIILKEGAWIGARATVCPGVEVGTHAVLSVGSVTSKNLEAYSIYRGNPAVFVKKRDIS